MSERRDHDVQGFEAVDSAGRHAGRVARAVTEDGSPRIRELLIEREGGGPPMTAGARDIRHIDDLARRVVLRPTVVPEAAVVDTEGQPARLTLRAEQPDVQVTARQAGEICVRTRIEEQRAAVELPLIDDRAIIARFDAAGDDPDPALAFTPYAVAVPLMRQRAAVERRTVVAEEVTIGRRAETEQLRLPLTLRRERLTVDDPRGLAQMDGNTIGATPMERGPEAEPGGETVIDTDSLLLSDEAVALGTAIIGERSPEYTFNADGSFREDRGPALGLPVQTPAGDVLGTVAEVEEDRFKVSVPLGRDLWLPITAITGQAPGGDLVVNAERDDL